MTSNDRLARLAGLIYLISLPTTGVWYGVGRSLVAGDAATTLANIQASRALFELVIVAGAAGAVEHLLLGLILYRLFGQVAKGAAGVTLAFLAAPVPLLLAAVARQLDVVSLLDGAQGLSALGSEQLQLQVMLALHSGNNLFLTLTMFWGLWLIPFGWLIFRSGFTPRVLGVLLVYGSLFYLLNFIGTVLDSNYANTSFARIAGVITGIPSVSTELVTALWLLVMGARESRRVVRPPSPAA